MVTINEYLAKLPKERQEYIMEQAKKAIKDYQQHEGFRACSTGYSVLRYARMGLYRIVSEETVND